MESSPQQVIFSSDASGQMWNTNVWDIQTGTSIMCYKGGSTAPRTLALVKGDYLIGAANNRPLLHVWALQRRDQMQLKMILPGKVGSLAVSPDGCYCVASISEQIHVWQVCTGELVAILHRHYQQISCLKFSDSSTFVSGGDDSLVLVWCLGSILADDSDLNARIEPKFVWADHSLPITDIHVGFGGIRSRLASSSLDQTCKIWDMNSGQLLCSFLFSISITAVTMDPAEYHLFAGGCSGHIFKCNLFERPVRVERHIDSLENDVSDSFTGHDKQVSCLCVSQDGALVSGSHDFTVKIWDVFSGQCLRTFLHKGIVTNVFVLDLPWAVLNPGHKPNQPISPFRRHLHSAGDDQSEEGLQTSHHFVCVNLQESEEVMGSVLEQPTGELKQELTALSKEKLKLEDKTAFLKNTNLRLFKIFANRILKM